MKELIGLFIEEEVELGRNGGWLRIKFGKGIYCFNYILLMIKWLNLRLREIEKYGLFCV